MSIFTALKKPWLLWPIVITVLIIIVLVFVFTGNDDSGIETEAVVKRDIEQIISETGRVEAVNDLTLTFELPGRINQILVSEGEQVSAGQRLISLDNAELRADLKAAEARLAELLSGADSLTTEVSRSRLASAETAFSNAKDNLTTIKSEQDLLIRNARRNLFSSNLAARLTAGGQESSIYSYTPPTISGTYIGDQAGSYVVNLYSSQSMSGYSIKYTGLESGVSSVSTVEPQALGSLGLYIQFPENFARHSSLEWTINIPNTQAVNYQSNLNAYESAQEGRDSAIQRAERVVEEAKLAYELAQAQYQQSIAPARAEQIASQRAVIERIKANLTKTELRAPFTGQITDISVSQGEVISPGAPTLNLVSDQEFEIVVHIAEVDIAEISVGDLAKVTLDAYRDISLPAEVVFVSPGASRIEGLATFKIVLAFSESNPIIKSGLTAEVDISAARRQGVLALPARAISRENDQTFVRLYQAGEIIKVPVTTGLRGVDGWLEIAGDLKVGDQIITFMADWR